MNNNFCKVISCAKCADHFKKAFMSFVGITMSIAMVAIPAVGLSLGESFAYNGEVESFTAEAENVYDNFGQGQSNLTKEYVDKHLGNATSVKISADVETIENNAFEGCTLLESVDFTNCSALKEIGSNAFSGCTSLKSVDSSNCNALQRIRLNAFKQCTSLESVDFSNCSVLTNIGSCALFCCTSLKSANFSSCSALTNIGSYAFAYCHSLESVNFSKCNVLTDIGECAFACCDQLKSANFLNYGALTNIGRAAFCDCTSLESVDLSNCSSLKNIEDEAFGRCTSLKSVDLSNCSSLADIGWHAFSGCTSLKSVNLSNCSVLKKISSGVFGRCTSLESVDLSNCSSLADIGWHAFEGCTSLKNLSLCNCSMQINENGYSEFRFIDDSNCITDKNIKLFKKLRNNKISININPLVTKIDSNAFAYYEQLKEIRGDNVTEISDDAFLGCYNLKIVKFPNLKICSASAFANCGNIDIDNSDLPENIKADLRLVQEDRNKDLENRQTKAYNTLDSLMGIKNREELLSKVKDLDKFNDSYVKNDIFKFFPDTLGTKEHVEGAPATHLKANALRIGLLPFEQNINKAKTAFANAENLIGKCTNLREIVLNRGVGRYDTVDYMVLGGQKLGTFSEDPKSIIGKIIADDAFTSTSVNKRVSEDYCNKWGSVFESVMFKLLIPAGTKMANAGKEQNCAEILMGRKQKYLVVDVGDYEGTDIRQVIAVALPSDEIGIERHKKGENGETLFSKQSSNELYEDPDFAKLQEAYELQLGKYLYNHPKAKQGVQVALEKMAEVLKRNYLKEYENDLEKLYREKFLQDKPNFSGAVGTNISRENLFALLEIDVPDDIKEQLNKKFETGNLREKMMAFETAAERANLYFENNKITNDIAQHINRSDREKEEQYNYLRDRDYQDKMGLERSQREKAYQNEHYNSLGEGAKDKSPITYGEMLYKPDFGKYEPISNFMGKRLISGSSGHAMRLINTCKALGMKHDDLINFRLALIAYLIPERNHSLYEVLQGAQEVGLTGGENLLTAETMDKYIANLSEEELRKNVCKYDIAGYEKYNGYFPIEALAEKKAAEFAHLNQNFKYRIKESPGKHLGFLFF